MVKTYLCIIILLTLAWCALCESFSLFTVASGALVSALCVLVAHSYLPIYRISGVSLLRTLTFLLYLLVQIYLSAFTVIKVILTRARVDIVEVKTDSELSPQQDCGVSSTCTPGMQVYKEDTFDFPPQSGAESNRKFTGNDFLKVLLAHSITLTPGTVSLDLNDDVITVLSLSGGDGDAQNVVRDIKGKMERRLLKAQKTQKTQKQGGG